MIENFDWNQFIFFPEDSSNEENLCVDNNVVNTPDVVSEFVVPESLRLLGYYNKPNQKMNPETVKVREAQQIYDLLTKSFENYTCQGEEYSEIINVFETAVFVFKDSNANLYAFFPHDKIARLSNVVYNKYHICKSTGVLRKWFKPGERFFVDSNVDNDFVNTNEIILSKNRTKINRYSGSDTEFVIPNFVREIGWHAFSKCISLKKVEIQDGVRVVGDDAFYYCENLEELILPDSVEHIGKYAFCGCHSLKNIKLPNHLDSISTSTFAECLSLASIEISDSVKHIYSDAFDNCSKIRTISLPANLISISEKAFQSCINLKQIRFPKSLIEIDSKAFRYCRSLSEIWFYNGNIEIGDRAFLGCHIHILHTNALYENKFKKIFPNAHIVCDIV